MLKKSFSSLSILSLLVGCALPFSVMAAEATTDTRLVKARGLATVYAIVDGHKMSVPRKAFTSGLFDKADVQAISYKELSKIPRVKYLSSDISEKVYSLSVSGKRALVGTEQSVAPTVQSAVVEVPQAELEMYPEITALKNLGTSPSLPRTASVVELSTQGLTVTSSYRMNDKGQVLNGLMLWDSDGATKPFSNYGLRRLNAMSMNNKGQVVGEAYVKSEDSDPHPFLIDNGKFQFLGGPNALGIAYDINDNGQIVGEQLGAGGSWTKAVMWENGQMKYLGSLGGTSSMAYKINSAGQVAGTSQIKKGEDPSHAFFWENGVMTDLGTLGGDASMVNDLNDNGQVLGSAAEPAGSDGVSNYRPVIWHNGTTTRLPLDEAVAINNNGQVLGSTHFKVVPGHLVPTFVYVLYDPRWGADEMVDLNLLAYPGGALKMAVRPLDINENGQILLDAGNNKILIVSLSANIAPQFTFLQPNEKIESYFESPSPGSAMNYDIYWRDADPEDNPKITFYYKQFKRGQKITADMSGATQLVGDIHQNDAPNFLENVSIPAIDGFTILFAVLDDGVNPPQIYSTYH